MISNIENIVLKGLTHDETYTRKVLPYLKDAYFETSASRSLFEICERLFTDYGSVPSSAAIAVEIEKLEGLTEDEFQSLGQLCESIYVESEETNLDFLIDTTEEWVKDRAIYLALLESISIHDGKKTERGNIPTLLTDALAVSFDPHVGHDYLGDFNERYDFYHLKEERISFGLDYFDKITKGGLVSKSLNIVLAGTGAGKSLFMCSLASSVLLQGKNVLYVTMEMAEERIAERIDANLLDTPIQDIIEIPRPMFESKVNSIQKKTQGQLFIKEYPTASAHAGHFDALIKELQLKKGFKPDIVFIDYLNICNSSRYSSGSNINSYTIVKSIAEELRGLAVKHNVPLVSATQTTRSGYGSSDIELKDTSESFGLPATADLMFALISNEELESMNQVMIKQLKNRYNDTALHRKFVVGIDRAKMRLYDVEQSAQDNVLEKEPDFKYNDNEPKFKTKSFADFNF